MSAKLVNLSDPNHHKTLAQIMVSGGIVGTIWGHHLYFLACNACDIKAVKRLNLLKGRPVEKVFVSPGAIEEVEEFADITRSKGLSFAAKKMKMKPLKYLEFLFRKFPLGVELFAKPSAPSAVTFATKDGKTIWIAGHMGDKYYSGLLQTVRDLRAKGEKIVFAGTSLNLRGENTLTVKDFDNVVADFGQKIDAISVHPKATNIKRLRFNTSCSVVSFIHSKPQLLRVGCTQISTLKKYIPNLQVDIAASSTRR